MKQINFRVSEEESALLQEAARQDRRSVSQYVRIRALSGLGVEDVRDEPSGELDELLKPKPPKITAGRYRQVGPYVLCEAICARKGRPSCEGCRKKNAKSMVDKFED